MTPSDLKSLLSKLGETAGAVRSNGWVPASCPLAPWRHRTGYDRNPSFAVTGTTAHCFSCGFAGSLDDLVWTIRYLDQWKPSGKSYDFADAVQLIAKKGITPIPNSDGLAHALAKNGPLPFPESWLSSLERAYHFPDVHPYLAQRQMPFEVARRLDIRFDLPNRRIVFPIRDFSGVLKGLHGRAIDDTISLKYLAYTHEGRTNQDTWFGEEWVNPEKPVLIAESVFDLARVYQVYRNVISPLTANPARLKLKLLAEFPSVWTLFDNDKAGAQGQLKIAQATGGNAKHLTVPHGLKDPGEMTYQQVGALLEPFLKLDAFLS